MPKVKAKLMKSYMIGYDLNKSGKNYNELFERIKKYGDWCHVLDSTWIVKSNDTALNICNYLKAALDGDDYLLVAEITREAAWVGLNSERSNWLSKSL